MAFDRILGCFSMSIYYHLIMFSFFIIRPLHHGSSLWCVAPCVLQGILPAQSAAALDAGGSRSRGSGASWLCRPSWLSPAHSLLSLMCMGCQHSIIAAVSMDPTSLCASLPVPAGYERAGFTSRNSPVVFGQALVCLCLPPVKARPQPQID